MTHISKTLAEEIINAYNNQDFEKLNSLYDKYNLNFNVLVNIALKSKNINYIYNLLKVTVNKEYITKLMKALSKLKAADKIYEYAIKSFEPQLDIIVDEICKIDNAKYIYLLASHITNNMGFLYVDNTIYIKKLENAVKKTTKYKDYYCYLFDKEIKKIPIKKLTHNVIKSKDATTIFHFANDYESEYTDELSIAIKKANNIKDYYEMLKLYFTSIDTNEINKQTQKNKEILNTLMKLKDINALIYLLDNNLINDTESLEQIKNFILENINSLDTKNNKKRVRKPH